MNTIIQGDCLESLKKLEDNSIDAIVTDPPYGLSFMGKRWDYDVPSVEIWEECLRVLKPGGYLLSFAGTRTQHRMAVRIEDAGFEIRDMIAWVYGQGFPKSTNIFKQLKKNCTCGNMEAYERATQKSEYSMRPMPEGDLSQTEPIEEEQGEVLQSQMSKQSSHKTMLREESKESSNRREEWSLERRDNLQESEGELQGGDLPEMPERVRANGKKRRLHNATQISDGSTLETTINQNRSSSSHRPQPEQQQDRQPCAFCKQYGTQAIGAFGFGSALKPSLEPITVARKPISEKSLADNFLKWGVGGINIDGCRVGTEEIDTSKNRRDTKTTKDLTWVMGKDGGGEIKMGRFPANLIHDGSDEVKECFPESKSSNAVRKNKVKTGLNGIYNEYEAQDSFGFNDSGNASRFFYCAKASKSERNMGCEGLEEKNKVFNGQSDKPSKEMKDVEKRFTTLPKANNHPTVKPIALMEYLIKLVSKEGHTVLDPFAGSGSTLIACKKLKRNYIGMELDPEYIKIAEARLNTVKEENTLF